MNKQITNLLKATATFAYASGIATLIIVGGPAIAADEPLKTEAANAKSATKIINAAAPVPTKNAMGGGVIDKNASKVKSEGANDRTASKVKAEGAHDSSASKVKSEGANDMTGSKAITGISDRAASGK